MSYDYNPISLLPLGKGLPEAYHCIHPKPDNTILIRIDITSHLSFQNKGIPSPTSLRITEKHQQEIHK